MNVAPRVQNGVECLHRSREQWLIFSNRFYIVRCQHRSFEQWLTFFKLFSTVAFCTGRVSSDSLSTEPFLTGHEIGAI